MSKTTARQFKNCTTIDHNRIDNSLQSEYKVCCRKIHPSIGPMWFKEAWVNCFISALLVSIRTVSIGLICSLLCFFYFDFKIYSIMLYYKIKSTSVHWLMLRNFGIVRSSNNKSFEQKLRFVSASYKYLLELGKVHV